MYEDLKQKLGIETANCETCRYLGRDCDGNWPEYAVSWPVCDRQGREFVSNLKSFPFKTEQKCWSPDFWHSNFAEHIKTGEEEEFHRVHKEFRKVLEEHHHDQTD